MAEKELEKADLEETLGVAGKVLGLAKKLDHPEVDISGLLGLESPLFVGVADLRTVVSGHPEPKLVLRWDGDKSLEVKKTDGGAIATLKVRF